MLPLYKVGGSCGHVVPQVVKAELIVRTKGNIGIVCCASAVGVGDVFVDAIHRNAMEHIEGSHPLRVTLSKVVIHRNDMHTIAR